MDDNSLPTQTLDIQSEIGFVSLSPKKNDSCWGRLVSLNSNMSADILLIHPVHTLGRKKDCTNVLSSSKHLSQVHCKIWKDDSGIPYLEDCSSNGTYVDKKKIGKGNKIVLNNLSEVSLLDQNGIFFIFKEQSESEEIYKYYDIRNQIGSGNFATVFLGISKKTSEKVAIKIIDIKRFKSNSTKDVSTIKDEINILREVDHPNVIKLIDSYQTEKAVYLVLEYVSGGELFDYIVLHKGKGIGEGNAKNIFKQITNAVHYLHQKGIVHRDLKPENILIMSKEDPVVKISDFGLSRMIDESTVAKTLCGTPQYLAAEVLTKSKEGYDKKVDIWSMGVILYILLCGQHPFDESNGNILDLIKSAQYNFNDSSWNSISPEAKDLIERMIVLDPKERYDSGEVLKHSWLTGKKLSSSLLSNPPPRRSNNNSNNNDNLNKNNLHKRKSNNNHEDEESDSTVISEEEKKEKKSKKRKNSASHDNHNHTNHSHHSNSNNNHHNSNNSNSSNSNNSNNSSNSNNSNNNGNNKSGSKVGSGSFKTGSISSSTSSTRSNSGSKSLNKNDSSDTLQKTDSGYDSDGGSGDNSKKSKKVQVCKYGPSCFRKNPVHFKEFSHPWLDNDNDN